MEVLEHTILSFILTFAMTVRHDGEEKGVFIMSAKPKFKVSTALRKALRIAATVAIATTATIGYVGDLNQLSSIPPIVAVSAIAAGIEAARNYWKQTKDNSIL